MISFTYHRIPVTAKCWL